MSSIAPPEPPTDAPTVVEDLAPPPPPPVVLEAVGLARRFGHREVLSDVSFTVQQGSAFGVVGANGSGKTVLVRLMASLDQPTLGSARMLGHDTVREAAAVRKLVGYLPEEPLLYDGVTAERYLDFVGRARGLGRQVRTVTVSTLLDVVGLTERRAHDVSTFSPGERRRLALAGALVHEPEVLLLDDPLRALDGYARLEQIEVLRELRRMGSTMLVTATRPEDALELCERVAVLRDGGLAWEGTTDDVAALANPRQARQPRLRVEVLDGVEAALTLLSQRRDVRELELDEDGQTIWFLLDGSRESIAGLLPQLLRAGCTVAHFGVERRSGAAVLATMLREPSA